MTVQNTPFPADLSGELTATLQWWRDAGVDCDFSDDATDWLKDPIVDAAPLPQDSNSSQSVAAQHAGQSAPETPDKKLVARTDFLGEDPPQDLDAFRQWWLETPGLDGIGPRGRIAPRGPKDAALMVLVVDPEEKDTDRLLSGPEGKLLSRIIAATGIAEDDIYFASALPRHTPMADTDALASGGLDAVTLHHIGLASPQRLIALGTGILPLIGQDVTKSNTYLREINQNARNVPVLMSEGLESLMAMPRLKARFWRRWIEWSNH
ncbi:MAG: hypothetical protein ABJN35_03900 [Erythrobacter sp.]